jgi:NADH:ubiquinone oxidoreductase subunit 5 (subunit L)/multisubunit Na+/H+ antiporter MnhA subunit
MLGLVLTDNLLVLYVCWELTSVTSYLLIGFDDTKATARAAALQALLITSAGGLAMLAGFVLLGQAAGTYTLSAILAARPSGRRSASPLPWSSPAPSRSRHRCRSTRGFPERWPHPPR